MAALPHYFIAVPLPDRLKRNLSEQQKKLKELLPYKQWTHPDDLHITLKFLGPVPPNQLNQLKVKLETLTDIHTFQVNAGSLGTFGNSMQPRVLWAGVEKNDALTQLQKQIEKLANESGFQQERRNYSPHITLAKKWNNRNKNLPDLQDTFTEAHQLLVNQVVIYRIFPQSNPKYKQIAAYQLKHSSVK